MPNSFFLNKSTVKKYLNDRLKVAIYKRVINFIMDKEKKKLFGTFSGNSDVTLAQTERDTCGGASELIFSGYVTNSPR